jgi:3-oxoisoapionate kinase
VRVIRRRVCARPKPRRRWRTWLLLPPLTMHDPAAKPTLVVVGSRSPVTAIQAQVALDHGFVEVPVDPAHFLADSADVATYRAAIAREVVVALHSGANTIVTTPAKSDDVPIDGTTLGQELSRVVQEICEHSLPQRLVIAGGDTSGHIARGIGVTSLRINRLMAPGAPLCHAEISGDTPRSLELCLKGGQVGPPDYFVRLAGARTSHPTTKERAQL